MSKPTLCVVLHDVAPATCGACQRVIDAIGDIGAVPLTLLAVPRYHCEPPSSRFERWLTDRHALGDEVALHGYTHLDDGVPRGFIDRLRRRHYTRGEGEFCDLPLPEAMRRLTAGARWFARLGLPLHGFVAPAWLIGPGTWEALRWIDLSYTCTLRRMVLLPERRYVESQSLVYSTASPWRRQASVAWNRALAAAQRHNPLLRLELHPHDADHGSVRRSWQRLLALHLAQRRASTLADMVERWRLISDWDQLGLYSESSEEDDESQRSGRQTNGHADGHVAQVVQPEHHA